MAPRATIHRRSLLTFLLLVLFSASPLFAADEPLEGKRKETAFERAVDICVEAVRREVATSRFDAFVENNVVRWFGTSEEAFKFEKCMSKRGHRLIEQPKPDRK